MIEISNLRVERDGTTICAVEQLSVATGERLAILGANGSGKTTLLRVLAGLTKEFAGECKIAIDHRDVTYLHQQPFMFRGTVESNVRYGQKSGAGQGPSAQEWLDRLKVGHLSQRTSADLSGGERRRVALARALATQPKLLLLDEPLADLDEQASATVCEVLTELANTTLLIASPVELPAGLVHSSTRLSS